MKIRGQKVHTVAERIFALSIPEPNSGCWLWMGTVSSKTRPYGRMIIGSRSDGTRKSIGAHRASFEAFVGQVSTGMEVCHRCDTPSCVNPDHLFVGTRQENVDDRERKNRNVLPSILLGESAPQAKFKNAIVSEVIASTLSSRAAAAHYGISPSYVRQLRRGEWRKSSLPTPPALSEPHADGSAT